MTWVIENKSTASKVALINLKVCFALLNIFYIPQFLCFHDCGVTNENSSCLIMSFQLAPFLCFHLIIPCNNFAKCISIIFTVLFAQGSSKIMARLPQEKLRCSLDLQEPRWSQC